MKRILFFIVLSTLTLTACHNDDMGIDNLTSSTGTPVSISTVPQSAKDLIASRYSGYSIKEVEQELEHGAKLFQVTIVNGNAKIRLLFDANWNFIGEKN